MEKQKTGRLILIFFVLAVVIAAVGVGIFFGMKYYNENIKPHVDYSDTESKEHYRYEEYFAPQTGSVKAVFVPKKMSGELTDNEAELIKSVLEKRLSNEKITDFKVKVDIKGNRITVSYEWEAPADEFDPEKETEALGKLGAITFCRNEDPSQVILSGSDVESAKADKNDWNDPIVSIKLTDAGTQKFAEATSELEGQKISVWMDDTMISSATVSEPITTGEVMISGDFTADEVEAFADTINASPLPYKLELSEAEYK